MCFLWRPLAGESEHLAVSVPNSELLERTECLIGVRTFPDFTDVILFKLL